MKKDILFIPLKIKVVCLVIFFFAFLLYIVLIIIPNNGPKNPEELFQNSINNFKDAKTKRNFVYIEDKNLFYFSNKKPINISLSSDNTHVFPTLIVMLSILENNDRAQHIIIFYLLLSVDFNNSNIYIFYSLKKNYEVIINYYFIPNIFKSLKKWRGSVGIYYKLFIPLLFPEIKRMIHLDGDTIVFKDLWEMFNLPFNNNYLLAQRTRLHIFKDKIVEKHQINAGVILFNIEKIREENKDFEIFYFLFKNKLTEQEALNYAIPPQIGYLPFKYGIWFMGKIDKFQKYMEYSNSEPLNITELQEALIEPSIVHVLLCYRKHWNRQKKNVNCKKYNKLFYYYANKTDYFQQIYNLYMK